MVLLMFFEALYFGHFLSFYTMQLEPPKSQASGPWAIGSGYRFTMRISRGLPFNVPCARMQGKEAEP